MNAEGFKTTHRELWDSFSPFTHAWLSMKERMQEPLEIVHAEAMRQLNNEQQKSARLQAAKEKHLKRCNELTVLIDDLKKAMKRSGITGKSRTLDDS